MILCYKPYKWQKLNLNFHLVSDFESCFSQHVRFLKFWKVFKDQNSFPDTLCPYQLDLFHISNFPWQHDLLLGQNIPIDWFFVDWLSPHRKIPVPILCFCQTHYRPKRRWKSELTKYFACVVGIRDKRIVW